MKIDRQEGLLLRWTGGNVCVGDLGEAPVDDKTSPADGLKGVSRVVDRNGDVWWKCTRWAPTLDLAGFVQDEVDPLLRRSDHN